MDLDSLILLDNVIAQLRMKLGSMHIAISRLAPALARKEDPDLDDKAALVDQGFYQVTRILTNLAAVPTMDSDAPLPLLDGDLAELVSDVFEKSASLAPLRGLETQLICPMERLMCAYDRKSMEKMLFQLLSNAFKFTPPGGRVTLELRKTKDRVVIVVEDTGPGIPKEQRFTLFARWRVMGNIPSPPQGTGLGLALCRRIARGHQGTLELDPSYTKGCRFVFSMPLQIVGRVLLSDSVTSFYDEGVNRTLLAMADALPSEAFRKCSLE